MFERFLNWPIQMLHRLFGHMLVTIQTETMTVTIYASSVFTNNGIWMVDDVETGTTIHVKPEYNVTITGA